MQHMLIVLLLAVLFFIGSFIFYIWAQREKRILAEYVGQGFNDAPAQKETAPSASIPRNEKSLPAKRTPDLSRLTSKPIVTPSERKFFHLLLRALPECHIFPQVAFSALLKPANGLSNKEHFAIFGLFSQKRADFVLCLRETLDIVAIIELDDSSHIAENDRKRDALLKAAGYKPLRFNSSKHTESELATRIKAECREFFS